jgi:ubiquinone biosynthesis protein UbiJ
VKLAPSALVGTIANRALAHEATLRETLAAHAGAVFEVAVGPAHVALRVDPDGTLAEAEDGATPALRLRVRARDAAALLHDPSRFAALVEADGDPALAATIANLCATLPWFVEHAFGEAFGAVLGQRLADTGRSLLGFPHEAASRLNAGVATYVRDEAHVAATTGDVRTFGDDVGAIAARVDLLAARVDALAARAGMARGDSTRAGRADQTPERIDSNASRTT